MLLYRCLTVILLLMACTVFGASRKEDMAQDIALTEQALARYGTFATWSDMLHGAREKFNRSKPEKEKLYSHGQFGNFLEAMQSVQKACDELGLDLIIVRQPSPAEKAFAAENGGQAPDPYIYLMQKMFADQKMELITPIGPKRPPLIQRLKERYPADEYSRKMLIFGDRKDFPGLDADFLPYSGCGAYFAGDLVIAGKKELLNRPAVVFSAPAELLYRESAVLPDPVLITIQENDYRHVDTWDAANWPKLGFEPVPEPEDVFFKILPDRSLQLAPVLPGADSGMAGTLRLPLPDPPGNYLRAVLILEEPAQLEVRATCGRDTVLAGVSTDRNGSRVELRLRPTWLSRLLTLQLYLHGKARLREIQLYRAN